LGNKLLAPKGSCSEVDEEGTAVLRNSLLSSSR